MVFSTLSRIRYTNFSSPSLDNFVFKLCYRWTVLLLVVFSFIVTCKLVLGDSFYCISNIEYSASYINAKCYADSTYTLPAKLIIQEDEASTLQPPVEKYRKSQHYYSWVNLFFLVHAFNFYLPHLLWKSFESGYMYKLTAGVQKYFDKEEKRELELCYLAEYVLITLGKHKLYTTMYILFEAINCTISLAQTLWLVRFFGVTGVPDSLPFTLQTWSDFRQFYFPPSGKCELKKQTYVGEFQRYTALCDMPLNQLFMKMYLFLLAWYIFITILTGMVLLYRIMLLIPSFKVFSSKISTNLAERSVLKSLCSRMSYSDGFFLSRLRNSMTDVDFAQMLQKISIIQKRKDLQIYEDKYSISEEHIKDVEGSDTTSPL